MGKSHQFWQQLSMGLSQKRIAVDNKDKQLEELNEKYEKLLLQEKVDKRKLRRANQMLELILDNVPQRIFWKDINSNYLGCNKPFANDAILNDTNQVVGKTDYEIFEKESAELFRADDQSVMQTKVARLGYEEPQKRRNGTTGWVSTSKVPLFDVNGKVYGVLGTYEDITNRKQAEILLQEKNDIIEAQNEEFQQLNEELNETNTELFISKEKAEESNRLKTAFLQNMSHEIRTPMNAILGFSSLLCDNFDDKENLKYYSSIITKNSSDLLELINDILNISKIESGQLTVNMDIFSLNDLLAEIKDLFSPHKHKNEKYDVNFNFVPIQAHQPITIQTDRGKLKQIFINLISNAFKFTKHGSIDFGLSEVNDNHLTFFVSDTGLGIPKQKQDLIFERFTQLNNDVTETKGGIGLGLSIVKGLVTLLDGDISLRSKEGAGSTFSFSIAYKPANIS